MDPLGFSLENYDWFGRWRTKSRGRTFEPRANCRVDRIRGTGWFREVILAEKLDDLARQVTRKMLSYGLGRQLEYYDEPAVVKPSRVQKRRLPDANTGA
ncbi:MAG: hypothetical protein CM1200mP29_14270 [Verrucomicrobiota bacterium]|nr:MAG: hypothetical protein CM1200mP29_14270 [Verrucomicrobiota bacterium]